MWDINKLINYFSLNSFQFQQKASTQVPLDRKCPRNQRVCHASVTERK